MEPWTPDKRMSELKKASEPLRECLKAHGDPYTSVIVTQYGATETQDERRVTFVGEKPGGDERIKKAVQYTLHHPGTLPTAAECEFIRKHPEVVKGDEPEPEPDALEFDRLRGELVDPLPVDYLFLWKRVASEYEKAWEAWSSGKRVRIPHGMIDALGSLSKRLTADLEKATGTKPEPAETVKRGRWEKSDIPSEEYVCSVCGGACWYYGYNGRLGKSRYCPNCGARMEDVT